MKKQILLIHILFLLIIYENLAFARDDFDHKYTKYTELLNKNVDNEEVDYKGIKQKFRDLNTIVAGFYGITRDVYSSWSNSQKLAFLINTYNAATLKLVVENYPLKSIKDIEKPWDVEIVDIFDKKISLNQLEHDLIRKEFNEPRIHFALVCAARGCPKLGKEAYMGSKINLQLESATKKFLLTKKKNSLDDKNKIIMLSPIFDWYKNDFNNKYGSVVDFIAPYYSRKPGDIKNYQIQYTYYDWSLNERL